MSYEYITEEELMNPSYCKVNDQERYSFIKQSITVLSAGGGSCAMAGLLNSVAQIKIFRVLSAKTAEEADRILGSERVHLCLLAPQLLDTDDHAHNLLLQYSQSTRFLVLGGQMPGSMNAIAIRHGVAEVIDNPLDIQTALPIVFRNAIEHILSYSHTVPKNSLFNRSLGVLLEAAPRSVEQWAQELGIASCTLREVWEKRGIPPKAALFLGRLYQNAFYYDCRRLFHEKRENMVSSLSENEYNRLYGMYFFKRSYWLEILGIQAGLASSIRMIVEKKTVPKNTARSCDFLIA